MPADEFEIIASMFAPLATDGAARGLRDDVAVIEAQGQLVVTTDAIVEGVHFLPTDPIDTVARKALRVNLSDLAAKAAAPVGALLTLIWPDTRNAAQIAEFARGLGEDLAFYGVALLGGDTTSTPGPLTVSMMLFGRPLGARTPSRADAKPGQDVWVTGVLGDACLGHQALSGAWPDADPAAREQLVSRYRRPEPRLDFAPTVARCASASMDVSDGLLADAHKLAAASGVRLHLDDNAIPLSPAAQAWIKQGGARSMLLSWGDDYEILFTAAPAQRAEIIAGGALIGLPVKRIGVVEAGEGLLVDGLGPVERLGYSHRLGA